MDKSNLNTSMMTACTETTIPALLDVGPVAQHELKSSKEEQTNDAGPSKVDDDSGRQRPK